MAEEFDDSDHREKLQAENDFLKMKLMLEHGAVFGENENSADFPPEIEHAFLRSMIEFEKQWENARLVKVFDKIGRPQHFKAVDEISEQEIPVAWKDLSDYLDKFGIHLDVCSPNISERELYRFTTEELFGHDVEDIDIPGMATNFIYDEFHPDPVYDNAQIVETELLGNIFNKRELFSAMHYVRDGFIFNERFYDDLTIFKQQVNQFKSLFESIEMRECTVASCVVVEKQCMVKGRYKAVAILGKDSQEFKGEFTVKLLLSSLEYWEFKEVTMHGFSIA